jgi:peptidoglycan hydrolase-like amidase
MKKRIILILLCSVAFFSIRGFVFAQTCDSSCTNADECRDKITKCQEAWNMMEAAKRPHVDSLNKMEADIAAFQAKIKSIEADMAKKALTIAKDEADMAGMLDNAYARMRQMYKRTAINFPIMLLFSSHDIGETVRGFTYQQSVTNKDKNSITYTALSIRDLEDKKKSLEKEQATLAYLKDETDKRAASVRKLVQEASAYQTKLSGYIANLTATQQSFLAAKLAGLNLPTSLGAGTLYCTDDRKLDPGFSPAYAFFTFGIPHRVGMNQYGALGRAQKGQSYKDILNAYFDGVSFEKRDANMRIRVTGFGEKGLDEYMLGVYEMPGSWPIEALKAQVVAARSYALSYTNNGAKEICTSQSCQVYKGGNKGGDWERAVRETEGEVMVRDGQPISAWFSSTDGGYTYTSADVGWSSRSFTKRLRDTNGDIGNFDDLKNKAYDKDSPCFYAAQGFRSQYGKSAWLTPGEVADIVNVVLLARQDGGTRSHLYQPDRGNPEGGETWGPDKVREELKNRSITPFSSISSINASGVDFGVGRTTQLSISGDGGSVSVDGSEFRDFFNLRAPANIQIVGPLYNIERK